LAEGVRLNHQNAVALITMLRNKRMIVQENGRKYSFKPDYHY
ncbi:urease subunit gamma, partial [Phocaeicola dorei]